MFFLFICCLRDKYLFDSFWGVKSCLCELPEYIQPGPFSVNPGVLISCDSFKRNLINQTANPRPEKDIITIRKVSQAAVCTLSQTEKPHWRKIKLQAALRGTCCRHSVTFCSLHGKCHEEEKEERTSERRSTKCKCDCAKMCFYLHWKCFETDKAEKTWNVKPSVSMERTSVQAEEDTSPKMP